MIAAAKSALRGAALAGRNALPEATRHAFAARAALEGLALAREHGRNIAAAYWPIRGEADPLALVDALGAAGIATALPVVVGRGRPLLFRLWHRGDPLSEGPHGLHQPSESLPLVEPDLLFVPLAAFDRFGNRIGYGAGHYDATLASLAASRPLAVGLAFAAQEVAAIPAEPHDHPLAFVITERETIACRTY